MNNLIVSPKSAEIEKVRLLQLEMDRDVRFEADLATALKLSMEEDNTV